MFAKVTADGMPLSHLIKPVHRDTLSDTGYHYLLINQSKDEYLGTYEVTPSSTFNLNDLESTFMSDIIRDHLSYPMTRAIPIKKSYRNMEEGIILGRHELSDIVLTSKDVSNRHAAFFCDEDGAVYIEDLGSTNGTYVHFEKLKRNLPRRVRSKEIISLAGAIPAAIISAADLHMLLTMLPEVWATEIETQTSIIIPRKLNDEHKA